MDFPPPEEYCCNMMQQILKLFKTQQLCDLVMKVEEKEFWVHRCVLAASCPTLHDIILKESLLSPQNTIHLTLKGFSANGFEALIEFLYSGKPPSDGSEKTMNDFKKACFALGLVQGENLETEEDVSVDAVNPLEPYSSMMFGAEEVLDVKQEKLIIEVTGSPENSGRKRKKRKTKAKDKEVAVGVTINLDDYAAELDEVDENISVSDDTQAEGGDQIESNYEQMDLNEKSSLEPQKVVEIGVSMVKKEIEVDDLMITEIQRKNRLKNKSGRPRLPNDSLFPLEPPFTCPKEGCTKVCETRAKLKKHYRIHNSRNFVCKMCSQAFYEQKDLIAHIRTHTGEKPFTCERCGATFAQRSTLRNHMESHMEKKTISCEQCGRLYSTMRSLNLHCKEKHSENQPTEYQCGLCKRKYKSKGAYLCHLRDNCGTSKFLCTKCGKKYRMKEPYEKHMKICNGKLSHTCEMCSKTFKTPRGLSYHTMAYHAGKGGVESGEVVAMIEPSEKRVKISNGKVSHVCELCLKSFKTARALSYHTLAYHTCKEGAETTLNPENEEAEAVAMIEPSDNENVGQREEVIDFSNVIFADINNKIGE